MNDVKTQQLSKT